MCSYTREIKLASESKIDKALRKFKFEMDMMVFESENHIGERKI